jgi:hypothetical protein
MRWRDIRFEKPTEADGDQWSRILILHKNGYFALVSHENASSGVAWIPTSELPAFDPIPDPPEGWRFVEKGEAFDKRAKYWADVFGWAEAWQDEFYDSQCTYIVPIDPPKPPEPQYRPFANAAEFEPHKNKWWRYKSMTATDYYPPVFFGDKGHGKQHWADSFENKVFEDGSPFGVRVEP